MKLFSWAHKKLLPSTSSCVDHQHNADHLFGVSRSNLACAGEQGLQATASRSTHDEVLTIGTLGMGNLLSRDEEEGEEEEEEEVEDDEEEEEEKEERMHIMRCMADSASPNRPSMSSNRESTSSYHASTSSNRASVSSNRESVSSVDIQKLQDELQKILYFKLGQEHEEGGGKKSKSALKAKGKKQKKQKNASGCYKHEKHLSTSDGKSHVPSERGSMRGVMPLHNFLEMPMDPISYKSTTKPFLNNTQYLLLMQSLKSKFLHYTSPTRVNFSTSLLERLVKPKINKDLQHGNTMDKMLQLLRKIMSKRPYRRSNNGYEKYKCEKDKKESIKKEEVEEEEVVEEEERLKWALAKSFRGSDRFINYIASIMEHTERNTKSFVNEEYLCHYPYSRWEKGSCLQLMPSTSPSLENECWIKTDDEYFVLEL